METNINYVGGRLQTVRNAKYGLFGRPKGKKDLLAGFQAPDPRINVQGGKKKVKKQQKFKSSVKGQEYIGTMQKELEKASKIMGLKGMSPKQEKDKIKKERLKFKSIVNKGATQIKKSELNSGSTQKANDAKKKYGDAMKETLKRLIQKHTLMALKEFNDRLK